MSTKNIRMEDWNERFHETLMYVRSAVPLVRETMSTDKLRDAT